MNNGVLAGYPVLDVKATLFDGSFHDVDSSEMAFKIAGSMAFKKGALEAQPVLLEPLMKVEITTPEDWMGDVVGDLNRRRGIIEGMDEGPAGLKIITLKSHCLRCLVMQLTCVLPHKAVLLTLWVAEYADVPKILLTQLSQSMVNRCLVNNESIALT